MAGIGKRKATDVDDNGFHNDDRPTLKRRGTSASSQIQQHSSQDHNFVQITVADQHDQYGRNDSAMSSYNDTYYPPPKEEPLQQQQQQPLLPTPPPSLPLIQDEFTPPSISHNDNNNNPSPSPLPFQTLLNTFCTTHGPSFGPRYLPDLQTFHSRATSTSLPSAVLAAGQAFTHTINACYIADLQAAALAQVQLRAQIASVCVDRAVLDAVDAVLARLDEQMIEVMAQTQGLEVELAVLEEKMMQDRGRDAEVAML